MKSILCAGILLFALSAFGQQGPPYTSPPHGTPPTFPSSQAPRVSPTPNDQTQQTPGDQPSLPPDTAPRTESKRMERPTSVALERTLRDKLAVEPILKTADLDVRVSERQVTVSGTVEDQRQHDAALQVVQSNAGDRQVVDKIKVRT